MHRSDSERQRDIVLGEAISELLDEKSAITNVLLILKLRAFLNAERELWKKAAIRSAIAEVTESRLRHSPDMNTVVLN